MDNNDTSRASVNTILFDFFGTLVQYSANRATLTFPQTHDYLVKHVIDLDYDVFISAWDTSFCYQEQQSCESLVEFTMNEVLANFLDWVGVQQLSEETKASFLKVYISEWSAPIKPFPELEALLIGLCLEYKLGIVSNTHYSGLVPSLLERFGLTQYFDVVITSVDHGRPKPHESIYHAALSALGAEPESTLFIGDSYEHDYLGSRKLGMQSVLISDTPPDGLPDAHVVAVVNDVVDVIQSAKCH